MDFARALALVDSFTAAAAVPTVLIGGLAMAAHGLPRTTFDLDLAVDGDRQDELIAFLEANGYRTLHRSSGYSNHLHSEPELGRIDLVYLRGATRDAVLGAARTQPGPGGKPIAVIAPEHLAAMKVLAMKNDPSRTFAEMADIRFLLSLPGVDRTAVERQFARHGLERRFRELVETA
jgi:hypothetical protein